MADAGANGELQAADVQVSALSGECLAQSLFQAL